jgi:hypothetical protein
MLHFFVSKIFGVVELEVEKTTPLPPKKREKIVFLSYLKPCKRME